MIAASQLRAIALSLPGTEERETWGEPTFRVRDKIFAMLSPDGAEASIKASLEDQAGLTAADPETYRVAAYVGRFGWVTVRLATADPAELRGLLTEAWRRTAPKRLAAAYDAKSLER